jgi:3-methylcrotonyl-CoA carboxylase alpha subunit
MFKRILIANRGEIACRVIRTARRMGIQTVAVYSEADSGARHVRLADQAVCIGPPPARESYLDAARILAAARAAGAEAIHPGYGFLSENEDFAEACAAAGIAFIGPPPAAIRAMGSKSEAKRLMAAAGVPLTPGYHGEEQEGGYLLERAGEIGYPVLIKASAGGGGKGMRVVERAADFAAALASCQREAKASFGDDRVLIEKYLVGPRHIEMQIFGDSHGNCVHLFERDCSVQRRHQKVLEEAPAPGLDAARREAMGRAAVQAARAVGYVGAGTVEFIVDQANPAGPQFYFMEMNTRLQVEHPVTEMITGLDLVEWQLRVAAGEPLPLAQGQIALRGHALEARLYAEDAERGFLPSIGRLAHFATPAESLHVRVDSGVEAGDEVTPHYDPMLAKLIVWDESRERALTRMLGALAECRIVGVASNVAFLSRLVASPAFVAADLDTALIERQSAFLFDTPGSAPPVEAWLIAALAELLRDRNFGVVRAAASSDPHSPWHLRDGWQANREARRCIRLRFGDDERVVTAAYRGESYLLGLDGQETLAAGALATDGTLRADLGGRRLNTTVVALGERRHVFVDGGSFAFAVVDPLFHAGQGGGAEGGLTAPMPGRIIALLVSPDTEVAKGQGLLVMEAMKMEHTIVAPGAGRVRAFRFAVGDNVADGESLLDFEAQA